MQGAKQRTLILEGGLLRLRKPNQFLSGVRMGGEMGGNCRELGSPERGGAGVRRTGAEPIMARVCEKRAGSVAARAIRADASGPGSRGFEGGGAGRGEEEKERRARVRSGAGRSRDLAAG